MSGAAEILAQPNNESEGLDYRVEEGKQRVVTINLPEGRMPVIEGPPGPKEITDEMVRGLDGRTIPVAETKLILRGAPRVLGLNTEVIATVLEQEGQPEIGKMWYDYGSKAETWHGGNRINGENRVFINPGAWAVVQDVEIRPVS
jgi:hypothetical protein